MNKHIDGGDHVTERGTQGAREGANQQKRLFLSLTLSFALSLISQAAHSAAWTGILSSSRAVDWSGAGATIQTRNVICSTVTLSTGSGAATNNTNAIQTAISGCNNGVVMIPAGTWYIAGITFGPGKSNVTLRGAGPDKTFLIATNYASCWGWMSVICIQNSEFNWTGTNGAANSANWTAGYSQGATQITLSSASNITVGKTVLILDQDDDASDPGTTFVCTVGGVCSTEDYGGNARKDGNGTYRNQQQFVTVTGCSPSCPNNGSTVVTISPGLDMPNWSASKNPGAWWATTQATGDGIENLSVDATNAGTPSSQANISFVNANNNWVKNVRSINPARSHVVYYLSSNNTVRDSYFWGTQAAASVSYGVEAFGSGQNLTENNLFQHVAGPLMPNGSASGSVISYNYTIDDYYNPPPPQTPAPGWMTPGYFDHGSTDFVLYEGNEGTGLGLDAIHASANFHTVFRNYFPGWSPGLTGDTIPINIFTFHRYMNIIGNVLGTSNYHQHYEDIPTSPTDPGNATFGSASIYTLGWATTQGQGCSNGSIHCNSSINDDPFTATTLMRWGNYDTVNSAPRWGAASGCTPSNPASCPEVPSGLSQYANLVPQSQTLPNSFYLNSQPSFWQTPWGTPHWPANGPDVGGGNIGNGHASRLPADLCFSNTGMDSAYSSGTNQISISQIKESGNTITVTATGNFPVAFNWSSQVVNISGASIPGYNKYWQITQSNSNSNTLTLYDPAASGLGTATGGTITVNPILLFNANACYGTAGGSSGPHNYRVKQDGTGDFTTIQACSNAEVAGDTCTVYAGTYNENVTLTAGTAGNYKTLTVNPGDTVYVKSFSIHSYDKVVGFQIQNPSSPNSVPCVSVNNGATYFYITNNTMTECAEGVREPVSVPFVSHGFIQGNTVSYTCSTPSAPNVCGGMQLYGSYQLIENNNISHVSDGFADFSGDHNIIRGNTMHDTNASDCGGNSSNCHIDFLETEPTVPSGLASQFNIIEGNTELNNLGANGHGWLSQGDTCTGNCHNLVIRFNTGAHVGSAGILDDNAENSSVSPGYYSVKSYNNTWADYNNYSSGNQLYGGTNGFTYNSTNGADLNDLFYYPESLANFNPYLTDATTVGTFAVGHDLAYCTGSPCNLHGKVYGSGSFTDDPGNQVANPKFVNYAANNFNLAAGSPAIGAGTNLTAVANTDTGSGTSLVVQDAGYFQDGYGIAGVQPDWIRVGPSTTVQIVAINYNTNTITLANSISRSHGDPVYLYKNSNGVQVLNGSAPDVGAYPYTGSGGGPHNYRVKQDGTGDFTTIQACANVAVAADTCTIFAGTYNETVTPAHSGSTGSPITFTANTGDVVTVTGGFVLSGRSYIVISYLAFQNTSTGDQNTTHNIITHCSSSGTATFFKISDGIGSTGSDNIFSYNVVDRAGMTSTLPAFYVYGDRNRFEYNEIKNGEADCHDLGGMNVVVRGEYCHDVNGASGEHIDFVQVIGGGTSPTLSYSLIESNVNQHCYNDGGNCHGFSIIRTGTGPVADGNLIRFNYAQNIDGDCINFGGVGDDVPNNSAYNNTCASEHLATYNGSFDSTQGTVPNISVFNNIAYNVESSGDYPFGGTSSLGGGIGENGNLAFTAGFSGGWSAPYSQEPSYSGLANKDPQFANYPTDGTLKPTSPAIGSGVAGTTASGSGSNSTSLVVGNAHLFQPGWAGVSGDCIRVGASINSPTTCITAANYTTNTLTVSPAISWNNGDPVYLFKNSSGQQVLFGSTPDIGAYPSTGSVQPPTELWSGILAPSRAIDWSQAGVIGGIPTNRTQCGSTIAAYTGSPLAINNAIKACGPNQYVLLGAGTFNLTSGAIDFAGHDSVTLRGSGPDKTFIVFGSGAGSGCIQGPWSLVCAQGSFNYTDSTNHITSWTSGFTKGTTQITLGSTAGLSVGQFLILDQANDTTDTNQVFVCNNVDTTAGLLGCDASGNGPSGTGRQVNGVYYSQQQMVQVTGISGLTVTISPGLYNPNWSIGKNPSAWWANTMIHDDGIEDLSFDATTSTNTGQIIFISNAYNVWVKNVRSVNSQRAHVEINYAAHLTVQDSYFWGTANASNESYGVEMFNGGDDVLIQNNIFQHIVSPILQNGNEGSVFAYNYDTDNYNKNVTWEMIGPSWNHSAGADFNLTEGNEGTGWMEDAIHGSHNFNTGFRNLLIGLENYPYNQPGKDQQTVPIIFQSHSRYNNVIGNALGASGYSANYTVQEPTNSGCDTAIYNFGFPGAECGQDTGPNGTGVASPVPNDPMVAQTVMRWGNYDVVNKGSPRFDSTEVPSNFNDGSGSPSLFVNPPPSNNNLPNSFYLSAKPAFWSMASPMVTPPWPAVGPGVAGGNAPGMGGYANHIPAQVCYANSPVDNSYTTTYKVTNASWSGGIATLTIGANNLTKGEYITVSGITPAGYNNGGNPVLTSDQTGGTSVSYQLSTNPGSYVSSGTVKSPQILLFNANNCYGSGGGGGPLTNVYISQSGAGTQDGSSCTNPMPTTFFNTASNWSSTPASGKIAPGTTVHICGTINVPAGTTGLQVLGSGTSGNPITILMEPGAVIQSPYLGSTNGGAFSISCSPQNTCSGGIVVWKQNYITLDGGTNGIIQNTANGTNLANQQPSTGLYAQGDHIVIRNFTIQNIYMNKGTTASATDTGGSGTVGIRVDGPATNMAIYNNVVNSSRFGISTESNSPTGPANCPIPNGIVGVSSSALPAPTGNWGLCVYNNQLSDHAWQIVATGPSGDFNIYANNLGDIGSLPGWLNWQFPINLYHQDGIFVWSDNATPVTLYAYNNYIHGDIGQGSPTGLLNCSNNMTNGGCTMTAFNNLLVGTGSAQYPNDATTGALIDFKLDTPGSTMGPMYLYNNTLIGGQVSIEAYTLSSGGTPPINLIMENNIFSPGVSGTPELYLNASNGGTFLNSVTASNNLYYNGATTGYAKAWQYNNTTYGTLAEWQAACNCDSIASEVANPNLASSYMLQSGSPAIGLGANLTGLNIPPLDFDKAGVGRPPTGPPNWDAGAYKYTGSGGGPLTDVYISQSGTGGGTSCSDPKGVSFFNTSGNWGSGNGQIAPGTTVHLCGTFTGTAGQQLLSFQGSGTSGNPITLRFESGAQLNAPYWSANGAINCSNQSYITVDGGTNGLIQNTANGTSLANHQYSAGFYATNCTNSEVKNLTIKNIYINQGSSSGATDIAGLGTDGIIFNGTSTNSIADNNTVSQAKTGIAFAADPNGDASNIQIYANNISDIDWGINVGGGDAGDTINNISIHDNVITNWTNWQFPTNTYHQDGVILFNYASGSKTLTATLYNNYIYGDLGVGSPTGFIYCAQNASCVIYNNLLVNTGHTIDGIVWLNTHLGANQVYNNTIVSNSNDIAYTLGTSVGTNVNSPDVFDNNLTVGVNVGIHDYSNLTADVSVSDHNVWRTANGQAPSMATNDSTFINYATWLADGFDAHSSTSNPNLNATYKPKAGSSAIGLGANLTGLNMSLLDIDKAGVTRPASGPWDAGAYQYSSGTSYSACDLDHNNVTNVLDVQLEVNMALTVTPCTGDINGDGACNVIDVQRIINAALGGLCDTGP